jgi:hypothetical protein
MEAREVMVERVGSVVKPLEYTSMPTRSGWWITMRSLISMEPMGVTVVTGGMAVPVGLAVVEETHSHLPFQLVPGEVEVMGVLAVLAGWVVLAVGRRAFSPIIPSLT